MSDFAVQVIETVLVLLLYVVFYFVSNRTINTALKKAHFQRARRKITIKALHLLATIAALVLIASIWGLEQNEIAVFATTILTAIGVAFFAQWSLLSNITSSIILFFTHPLRLGDTIRVLDKEHPFEGEVYDLTYFFIHLRTKDGALITVPNSLILQKSVAVIPKQEGE